jgi:hypothetical protein
MKMTSFKEVARQKRMRGKLEAGRKAQSSKIK